MKEITLNATVDNVEKVTEFVNEQLERIGCPAKAIAQIDIAIDELFSNIAYYAYSPEVGPATVRVDVEEDPVSVTITFMDRGVPFNPLKKADPDTSLSAEERKIGGLGIFMVKRMCDDVSYLRDGNANVVAIRKSW